MKNENYTFFLLYVGTGWAGMSCASNVDECANNSCQNGATCKDGVNSYSCECLSNFTGKQFYPFCFFFFLFCFFFCLFVVFFCLLLFCCFFRNKVLNIK